MATAYANEISTLSKMEAEIGCNVEHLGSEVGKAVVGESIFDAIDLLKEGKELAPSAIKGLRAFCKKIKEKDAKDPKNCWLKTEGRGIGTMPDACPQEAPKKSGLLCYKECNADYTGLGPVCW